MYSTYTSSAGSAFHSYSYKMHRASMGYFEYPIPSDLPKIADTKEKSAKNTGWRIASSAIITKAAAMYPVELEKYNRKIAPLNQLMESFEKLKSARNKQWAVYKSHMDKILTISDYSRNHFGKDYSINYKGLQDNFY